MARPLFLSPFLLLMAMAPPEGLPAERQPHQLFVSPSGEPFEAAPDAPYPVADWFAQADANHDGQLTRSELVSDGARYFPTLDGNGDGVIDAEELQHYDDDILSPAMIGAIGGGGQKIRQPGMRAGPGLSGSIAGNTQIGDPAADMQRAANRAALASQAASGAGRYGLTAAPEPVKGGDADLNGRVSREEYRRMLSRRYDALDTEQAGFVTLDDLPQTLVQGSSKRGKR